MNQAELELAVESFLDKLRKWLVMQPEWPVLMGGPDRRTRRQVAKLIAEEVTTIPKQRFTEVEPNRKLRRYIIREMERADREWWKGVKM